LKDIERYNPSAPFYTPLIYDQRGLDAQKKEEYEAVRFGFGYRTWYQQHCATSFC